MQEFLRKDFAKILKHNGLDARRLMRESDSTVARIYDRNLDGLDLSVDLYGPYARILDYGDEPLSDAERTEVIDIVRRFLYVESDKVIYKERKKRPNGEQHEKGDESLIVDVKENSHLFKTELLKYVDTGLFLDQAKTRKALEESALGLKVLNLFSYTGSFSVYAAYGGAERVDSVDLSNVYTAWARENLDANGFFDQDKYPTIASDAEAYVEKAVKDGRKWDVIIFDPPSFSNSHKAHDFDLKKDYLFYLYNFTKLLNDGGVVIFSENLSSFNLDKGKIKAYYKTQEMTDEFRAFGFTRKRSTLRIFRLEKVKEFKGEVMKRIIDDDSLEMLSLKEEGGKREKKPVKREERREERRDYGAPRRSYGIERGSFKDRKSFDGDERSRREERRFDDRPSYGRDFDRYERRSYGERRRDDDFSSRRKFSDARPERRSYDRPDYDRKPRWDRDDRPRRDYQERPRRYDDRPRREDDEARGARRFEDRRERPSYSEDRPRRARKAPVPYGYDEFRRTKGRDEKKND